MRVIILDGASACGKSTYANSVDYNDPEDILAVHTNHLESAAGYSHVFDALDDHEEHYDCRPQTLILDRLFPCQHVFATPPAEYASIRDSAELWCARLSAERMTLRLYLPREPDYKFWLAHRDRQKKLKSTTALGLSVPEELGRWYAYDKVLSDHVEFGKRELREGCAPWAKIHEYLLI